LTDEKLPLNPKTDKKRKKMAIRRWLPQSSVESPAVLYFSSDSYPSSRAAMASTDAMMGIIPPAAGELINPMTTPVSFFIYAHGLCRRSMPYALPSSVMRIHGHNRKALIC